MAKLTGKEKPHNFLALGNDLCLEQCPHQALTPSLKKQFPSALSLHAFLPLCFPYLDSGAMYILFSASTSPKF